MYHRLGQWFLKIQATTILIPDMSVGVDGPLSASPRVTIVAVEGEVAFEIRCSEVWQKLIRRHNAGVGDKSSVVVIAMKVSY